MTYNDSLFMIDEEDIQNFISKCEAVLKQKLCCETMQSLQGPTLHYMRFADGSTSDLLSACPKFLNFSWSNVANGVYCGCLSVRKLDISYLVKRLSMSETINASYFWPDSVFASSLDGVFPLVKPRLKKIATAIETLQTIKNMPEMVKLQETYTDFKDSRKRLITKLLKIEQLKKEAYIA